MLPSRLLPLLTAPGTDAPLRFIPEWLVGEEPFSGWLLDNQRRCLARLLNFRFRFVDFDAVAEGEAAWRSRGAGQLPPMPGAVPVTPGRDGYWEDTAEGLLGGPGAMLGFESSAPVLVATLLARPGGGVARILKNGAVVQRVSLDSGAPFLPVSVTLENAEAGAVRWHIQPEQGPGLLLAGIQAYAGEPAPPAPPVLAPRREEARLHPAFAAELVAAPAGSLVLDLGGGRRHFADARYLNLDCLAYEEPRLLADPARLPLRSGSVALVHAGGAINRTVDPAGLVREAWRVLRPGGRLMLGSLPAMPGLAHYLDLTQAGLAALLSGWQDARVSRAVEGGHWIEAVKPG